VGKRARLETEAVTGEDQRAHAPRPRLVSHPEAAAIRQVHVGYHEIKRLLIEQGERVRHAFNGNDVVSRFGLENVLEKRAHVEIVFHEQDTGHGADLLYLRALLANA
jgi:hypothetical protein